MEIKRRMPPGYAEEIESEKKLRLKELIHEKLIRSCRADPNTFISYAGSFNNPRWYKQAPLHTKWQNAISEHSRVLLICPREHGKTSQLVLRIVWEMGNNPNIRIKLVCQSDDTAVKRLTAIIDYIENNPRVKEVFPDLGPAEKSTWTKSKIYVKRSVVGLTDPTIESSGILSTATGGRADLLVFDDPVDFRNAIQQPALRPLVKDVYANVWINLLDENGRVLYIATPWHRDDLTHMLLENNAYHHETDSIDDNFTPIWPEKWPKERLLERLDEIKQRAFDRAFRNKALSDEDVLFPPELLESCYDKGLKYGKLPNEWKGKKIYYFMGVDIAAGKSQKSGAFSVIFTMAYCEGTKVPVSIVRGRYSSPQLANLILQNINTYKPELVYVENNATQESLIQWVNEIAPDYMSSLPPVRGYHTGKQKMDERIGLPGIAVELEQGSWKIPHPHEGGCNCGLCSWISEMSEYPIGKYSDTVMAAWLCSEALRHPLGVAPPTIRVLDFSTPKGVPLEFALAWDDDDF